MLPNNADLGVHPLSLLGTLGSQLVLQGKPKQEGGVKLLMVAQVIMSATYPVPHMPGL